MRFFVIVDGPNLFSRIIDFGIDKELMSNSLSLNYLYNDTIKIELRKEFGSVLFQGIELICSEKCPGPRLKKLSNEQYKKILCRLSNENAVYINKISISSNNEKGVDIAVATRLIEVSEICDIVCLISSDKDYIPLLEYLRRKGKYIITVGIDEKHPTELKNLSYLFIDLSEYFKDIFPGRKPIAGTITT